MLSVLTWFIGNICLWLDYENSRVFVDRNRSGQVDFNPKFPGVHDAPLPSPSGAATSHVFIDACSVEVFVNDGELVFTDLIFPSPANRGVELFGPGTGPTIRSLEVWTLKSSWR
jgi:sucrose-6-phosphate hydrolase SacC (GH32 family)